LIKKLLQQGKPNIIRGTAIRKKATPLLFIVFLTAPLIMAANPVSATTPVENSWTPKAPMHQARSNLGVATVNGKIYAIGGSTHEGDARNITINDTVGTNEEYDPVTDKWTYRKSMPTPRIEFAIATFENKIYCIGGYLANGLVTGVNEVYDPETNTWETRTPIPTPRVGLKANVANGRIYFMGGYEKKLGDLLTTSNITYSTLNEVYNPRNDSWVTMKPLPTGVSAYVSAVVDNKIYVIGGVSNIAVGTLNQVYDAVADSWNERAVPPPTIAYGVAVATTGINAPKRIYIFVPDWSARTVLRVYDPEREHWSIAAAPSTKRGSYGVAIVNDVVYVIGGGLSSEGTFPDSWLYGSPVTQLATNEQYIPFGFSPAPPAIAVVSPENETYASGNVSLAFTVNKQAVWMGYSLDGQNNVTISSNTTITDLSNGLHNVTVYARDEFDNVGASATLTFDVKVPEPFPIIFVVAASAATAVVVGVSLLVYFKKRKH
jgi:N-acetylneuraminic acid mutarotase